MEKATRFTYFTGLEGAHFEKAMGTAEECIKYCSKEETRSGGPYIFGKPNLTGQGKRSDIIVLRNAIRDGASELELFNNDNTVIAAVQHTRGMDRMVLAYRPEMRRDNVRVTFHFGPSGTGKTHCAEKDDAFWYDGLNGFWDGYQGEEYIILDEFGGHCMQPLMFQRLCDKYPLRLNIKGGSTACNATDIHICSNYMPDRWWKEGTRYDKGAIYRRIHEAHYHDKIGHFHKFVSDEEENAMNKLEKYISRNIVINYVS